MGTGDADYKAFFGGSVSYEANLVLFRRTLSNRAWCGSHRLFRGVVQAGKRLLGKKIACQNVASAPPRLRSAEKQAYTIIEGSV